MSEHRDPEKVVREIKRKTRRKYSSEEKIRIVLEGLRGEESIAELCRRERISPLFGINPLRNRDPSVSPFQVRLAPDKKSHYDYVIGWIPCLVPLRGCLPVHILNGAPRRFVDADSFEHDDPRPFVPVMS